jgi:hypothetical protein
VKELNQRDAFLLAPGELERMFLRHFVCGAHPQILWKSLLKSPSGWFQDSCPHSISSTLHNPCAIWACVFHPTGAIFLFFIPFDLLKIKLVTGRRFLYLFNLFFFTWLSPQRNNLEDNRTGYPTCRPKKGYPGFNFRKFCNCPALLRGTNKIWIASLPAIEKSLAL